MDGVGGLPRAPSRFCFETVALRSGGFRPLQHPVIHLLINMSALMCATRSQVGQEGRLHRAPSLSPPSQPLHESDIEKATRAPPTREINPTKEHPRPQP